VWSIGKSVNLIECSVGKHSVSPNPTPHISRREEKERERSIVRLKYKTTLSSIVVSRLGGSLPKTCRARIVEAELKLGVQRLEVAAM
jgi:hypothetical protein